MASGSNTTNCFAICVAKNLKDFLAPVEGMLLKTQIIFSLHLFNQ